MLADRSTEPDRRNGPSPPQRGRLVIGVDVGGTKILAGAVDSGLGVVHRARRATPTEDVGALLDAVVSVVGDVRAAVDGEVGAVGLGIPCVIDRGRAESSVHLPIADVCFAQEVSARLGIPAFVDNDANLALLAEHRAGAAVGVRHAVMLTLGTGIGGGLLLDGEIYRGSRGGAGELGHLVVWADGPDCGPGCPSRGCLEALASGTALVREARRLAAERPDSPLGRAVTAVAGGRLDAPLPGAQPGAPSGQTLGPASATDEAGELTGPLVTELALRGDPAAVAALASIGRWLGVGIASIVNIFNPEVVVVGGGVIAAGELVLGPARAVLAERALPSLAGAVRVVAAQFAADSGMLGAAVFAYESINRRAAG